MTISIYPGIIFIIIGIVFIIYRKDIRRGKTKKGYKIDYVKELIPIQKSQKPTILTYWNLIGGILAIIIGVLDIMGLLPLRK
jgi:hypothetical protein